MAGRIVQCGENTWMIQVLIKKVNGKRTYKTTTIHGTKKEADAVLRKQLVAKDEGKLAGPTRRTLKGYLDEWLIIVRPKVAARTVDGWAALFERYIRGPLGNMKLEKVQTIDLERVYAEMLTRGLSAQTVRHTNSALKNAFNKAIERNLLKDNPAIFKGLPKVKRKEFTVFSEEGSREFLKWARIMPKGLIFEFALLSGMRPEEYLALQWKDLDAVRYILQVNRALVQHKGKWTFETAKTEKSHRPVEMPELIIQKLKAHRKEQLEIRMKNGKWWEDNDLIFCSEYGTPYTIPNLTYRYFRPILEKAELPKMRLYDLRHSHATLLLKDGEHVKVVSERLGHSTVKTTLDIYAHVLPGMQKSASARVSQMFYGT